MTRLNSLSQAAENNKDVILQKLREIFAEKGSVLEIGSGTGQHATHFASNLTHLNWQPTDQGEYLPLLVENLEQTEVTNLRQPLSLDVMGETWPVSEADYIYSANTLHIMSSRHVECFMRGAGACLRSQGSLVIYGPFKYGGEFTTDSNAKFDLWLKGRDEQSGVRDIEWLKQLADENRLRFLSDYDMPANNQLLVFRKQ